MRKGKNYIYVYRYLSIYSIFKYLKKHRKYIQKPIKIEGRENRVDETRVGVKLVTINLFILFRL